MSKKKKKKSVQARQQRKRERRKAMVKKRKRSDMSFGSVPRRTNLFSDFQASGGAPFAVDTDEIIMKVLDSSDLMDAPEFDEIIVTPLQAVETFVQIARKIGLPSDAPEKPMRKDLSVLQPRLFEETVQQLLDENLRKEILNALEAMQRRLKRSRDSETRIRASLVQTVLSKNEFADAWSMIGLVQAIVRRSVAVGYDILEASQEALEDPAQTEASFMEKLRGLDADRKAEALLEKYPGFQAYLRKQADQLWREGSRALMKGDLYLGIFSPDEIRKIGDIMIDVFGYEMLEKALSDKTPSPTASHEHGEAFLSQVEAYITELMTPERLEQLQTRLDEVLKDPAYEKWWFFIALIASDMAGENAVKNGKATLLAAYMGEFEVMGKAASEADGGSPDDRENGSEGG